jgi:hypothetical protein
MTLRGSGPDARVLQPQASGSSHSGEHRALIQVTAWRQGARVQSPARTVSNRCKAEIDRSAVMAEPAARRLQVVSLFAERSRYAAKLAWPVGSRSRTSGQNLLWLPMTPSSQDSESPGNPQRLNSTVGYGRAQDLQSSRSAGRYGCQHRIGSSRGRARRTETQAAAFVEGERGCSYVSSRKCAAVASHVTSRRHPHAARLESHGWPRCRGGAAPRATHR